MSETPSRTFLFNLFSLSVTTLEDLTLLIYYVLKQSILLLESFLQI